MTITEIIISIVLIAQFIYLFIRRTKDMAVIDDLRTAVTNLDGSIDSVIAQLQELRNQLGNSVLAADVEVEITRLQALKQKLDNAQQQ